MRHILTARDWFSSKRTKFKKNAIALRFILSNGEQYADPCFSSHALTPCGALGLFKINILKQGRQMAAPVQFDRLDEAALCFSQAPFLSKEPVPKTKKLHSQRICASEHVTSSKERKQHPQHPTHGAFLIRLKACVAVGSLSTLFSISSLPVRCLKETRHMFASLSSRETTIARCEPCLQVRRLL